MTDDFRHQTNLLRMYTVLLVSEGSEDDTEETFHSNRQVLLTCYEYLVMDLRNDSDRARIPTDMAFQELYEGFMTELEEDVKDYMKAGKVEQLKELLKIMAPNRFTYTIKKWLKAKEGNKDEQQQHKKIEIQIG